MLESLRPELERRGLEDDILRITQTLVARKKSLNALTPSHCLPPEILTEIFALCVDAAVTRSEDDGLYSSESDPPLTSPYSWIHIIHVCHRWREVALQAPILWCNIIWTPAVNIACVSAMLERSKQCLIRVTVLAIDKPGRCPAFPLLKRILAVISGHLSRAVSISITLPGHMWRRLPRINCSDLSNLTVLSLSSFGFNSKTSTIFNGRAIPNLRYLSLSRMSLNWGNPALRHAKYMVKLVLNTVVTKAILTTLMELTGLRHLDLSGAFTVFDNAELEALSCHIPLPHLTFLRLSGGSLQITHLWRTLDIPTSTPVKLEFKVNDGNSLNLPTSSMRVAHKLKEMFNADKTHIQSLSF
ncbi:hypothetical protein BXZ70DRAFT_450031 [Cristinia sonorae]|uniref:F-box domain-containing protein n=1 Tax=Cristinia sonorae TaxID=1940300 RepID=A0A8K0UHZ2_9AGAR|nr:hypothetical protein BXZ70DRAFT_450031 [Cristinia sonorae]